MFLKQKKWQQNQWFSALFLNFDSVFLLTNAPLILLLTCNVIISQPQMLQYHSFYLIMFHNFTQMRLEWNSKINQLCTHHIFFTCTYARDSTVVGKKWKWLKMVDFTMKLSLQSNLFPQCFPREINWNKFKILNAACEIFHYGWFICYNYFNLFLISVNII